MSPRSWMVPKSLPAGPALAAHVVIGVERDGAAERGNLLIEHHVAARQAFVGRIHHVGIQPDRPDGAAHQHAPARGDQPQVAVFGDDRDIARGAALRCELNVQISARGDFGDGDIAAGRVERVQGDDIRVEIRVSATAADARGGPQDRQAGPDITGFAGRVVEDRALAIAGVQVALGDTAGGDRPAVIGGDRYITADVVQIAVCVQEAQIHIVGRIDGDVAVFGTDHRTARQDHVSTVVSVDGRVAVIVATRTQQHRPRTGRTDRDRPGQADRIARVQEDAARPADGRDIGVDRQIVRCRIPFGRQRDIAAVVVDDGLVHFLGTGRGNDDVVSQVIIGGIQDHNSLQRVDRADLQRSGMENLDITAVGHGGQDQEKTVGLRFESAQRVAGVADAALRSQRRAGGPDVGIRIAAVHNRGEPAGDLDFARRDGAA